MAVVVVPDKTPLESIDTFSNASESQPPKEDGNMYQFIVVVQMLKSLSAPMSTVKLLPHGSTEELGFTTNDATFKHVPESQVGVLTETGVQQQQGYAILFIF